MSVTASMVKELREITGAGMMDCKNVLMETDGDIEKAVELLREKGIAKAAKKADRIAAQGLVRTAFSKDGKTAAIIEVNSETDFVAKNQEFIDFVDSLAKLVMENDVKSKDEFMDMPFEGSTVQEVLKSKIAKIGENMNIRRFEKFCEADTVYKGYIHSNGTIGVIVGIKTEASGEETEEAGKDVAMQVASMNPRFLDGNDVDPEFIAEEKKILTQQVLNEGKKPEMVDRIVEGKLKKELKEYCLLEQKFVKDSEVTVKQYIENTAKAKGKEMEVTSFVRFEVGEGIEKKEEDFAEEVAKQMDMNK